MKIIIKCTDGIMTGKEWRFNGSGQITLGREKGSMVTTAPEDNSISRHQCVIDVVPPNVYVSDAGSTHGTYVNGQLIGKKGQGGQCPVRDGAFIGVGSGGRTAVFQIRIIELTIWTTTTIEVSMDRILGTILLLLFSLSFQESGIYLFVQYILR